MARSRRSARWSAKGVLTIAGLALVAAGLFAAASLPNLTNQLFAAVGAAAPAPSLSGVVWEDANGNGKIDAGEKKLAGEQVILISTTHGPTVLLGRATTDTSGAYSMTNIPAGTYKVEHAIPDGSQDTTSPSVLFTLAKSGTKVVNFGVQKIAPPANAALSGVVWEDANANQKVDNGEKKLAGEKVQLLSSSTNAVVKTATTDATGAYSLTSLAAGTYLIKHAVPAGYQKTTDESLSVTLTSTVKTVNFGVQKIPTVTVSGTVWEDTNANKKIDSGEGKLSGENVLLLNNTTGATLRTVTTDASGAYSIAGVTAGTYKVQLSIPVGYVRTTSDPAAVTLTSADKSVDFGVKKAPLTLTEKVLNPFGDPWSLRTAPNSSIPLAGTPGCYRNLLAGMSSNPTPEELHFYKALGAQIFYEDCATVLNGDPVRDPDLQAHIALVRSANPAIKFMGYFGPMRLDNQAGSGEVIKHESWLLHAAGKPPTVENRLLNKKDPPGPVVDITNPEYQDFIAGEIARSMNAYGMNAVMLDGANRNPSSRITGGTMPPATLAAWPQAWADLIRKIKTAVGPNVLVFANVPRNDLAFDGSLVKVLDGVMLEDPLNALRVDLEASGLRANYEGVLKLAEQANKYAINIVNTNVNSIVYSTTNRAQELAFERYFLATHLVFLRTSKDLLMFYTPVATGDQFRSEVFFADWNTDVGAPAGSYQVINDPILDQGTVYMRQYANAQVYLNNSNSTYTITLETPLFTLDDVQVSGTYDLPAKSGMIFTK